MPVSEFCILKPDDIFVRKASGMVRGYNLLDMFVFNMNGLAPSAMMSGMVAITAAYYPAANVLWTLLLASPFVFCFAYCYAALSAAMPRSGGDYVFASRIINPVVGLAGGVVYNLPVHMLADAGFAIYFFTYVIPMTLVLSFPGNPTVQGMVNMMSNNWVIFGLGTVVTILAVGTAILGAKVWKAVMWIIFIFGMISVVLIIGILASTNTTGFIQAFNAFAAKYGTSYDGIIQTATAKGWQPTPDSIFISIAPMVILYTYVFTAWPVWMSSEVKSAEKSVPFATFASIILAQIIGIVIAALYENVIPKDFMSAASYLAYNAPSGSYPLPWNPEIITIISSIAHTPIVTLLIGMGITMFNLSFIFGDIVITSRTLFYWSFDRLIPKKFASLTTRWRTPAFALIFYGIIVEIALAIALSFNVLYVLSNCQVLIVISFTPAQFAALFLAYRGRSIWEKAPGWVQKKIAGIPLLAVIGGVSSAFQVVMIVLATLVFPLFGGPITLAGVAFMLFWILVAIPWYYFARYYHLKKEGMDIAWAFKSVPPA